MDAFKYINYPVFYGLEINIVCTLFIPYISKTDAF